MKKLFNNILLPVYSCNELKTNINKVIELGNTLQCNIHLIYFLRENAVRGISKTLLSATEKSEDIIKKLAKIREYCIGQLNPALSFSYLLLNENAQHEIMACCCKNNIDLILMLEYEMNHREKLQNKVNMNRLANKIDSPVLTLRLHEDSTLFRDIVLPVDQFLPLRQLMFASYVGKYFHSKIHLISLRRDLFKNDPKGGSYLYEASQLIQNNSNLPIECTAMEGRSIEDATYHYAAKVNADLILLSPVKKGFLPGLVNWLYEKFLYPLPKASVMTI